MIGYITLGSSNLDASAKFYSKVLSDLGGKEAWRNDRMVAFKGGQGPQIMLCTPYDGKAPTPGNGAMIALLAPSKDAVAACHASAMAAGAVDEGAPGPRGDTGFFGAYFRDPDGNKICAFCMVR